MPIISLDRLYTVWMIGSQPNAECLGHVREW